MKENAGSDLWVLFLQYRTSRLLHSVAMRLNKHSKTLGSFGAWNRCLNHLLTLAESHIESVILAKFIEAVKRFILCIPLISYRYFSSSWFCVIVLSSLLCYFTDASLGYSLLPQLPWWEQSCCLKTCLWFICIGTYLEWHRNISQCGLCSSQ